MNTLNNSLDRSAIEEEAGAWIIKLDGDAELSLQQRQAFKEWMSRSPAHRDAVKSLAQFWGKMNVLTELALPQPPDTSPVQSQSNEGLFWFTPKFVGAALSICLLVTVVWFQGAFTDSTANGLYATAVGQQQTIYLDDGSEVQLNTNSQIDINYSDNYRDIHLLQGEAHFIVAKNKRRPFRVAAGRGQVRAIGTAFSVYLNRDDIEVTLIEGRVALQSRQPDQGANPQAVNQPPQELAQLTAGQAAVITAVDSNSSDSPSLAASIKAVNPQEMSRRMSWRKGFVTFKGTPLDQVITEVGRYSQTTIELTDPAMAGLQIGGQFRVGEIEAILESLEKNFGLNVERVAYNHVQISYKTP